ncbi:MAG: SixA phosphatase family protein [Ferruginibacter sp.]
MSTSTTKTVLLIRHAKSSWEIGVGSDFERPLNERGKRDAPMMAQRLLAKQLPIDAFVSSTANRAATTAAFFIEAFGRKKSEIEYVSKLYHADWDVFLDTIHHFNDSNNTVAIFSHNPGITYTANILTNEDVSLDNMPTCGIFAITFNVKHWKDIKVGMGKMLFFDYPKA